MKKLILFFVALLACHSALHSQQGKDGIKSIAWANVVLNDYTSLITGIAAGSDSINVANAELNANQRFEQPLGKGDLLLIIQMQGASIKGNINDSTWGTILNYNNCGLHEFAEVASVPNTNTIKLTCRLRNTYTLAGKVQVVRVPRLELLTVGMGGAVTCDAWNGTVGGITAIEVQGVTTIDTSGEISATAKGFRGGALEITQGNTTSSNYYSTNNRVGAQKGESIAGYTSDYTMYGGMYGRGAPGNGGGGGSQWNSSGGGGANAGLLQAYTGNGNPDILTNPAWQQAWDLEGGNFSYSISSGGGRGGYTIAWFYNDTPSPLIYPPGHVIWGDTTPIKQRNRRNVGGKGGRPLDYSTGRIFLGGGGGAGHQDQGSGGAGGAGGGIVYLLSYGGIEGAGSITANGQDGLPNNAGYGLGDGAGGAGGGGTILVYCTDTISDIMLQANGGKGGDQFIISNVENEGPGGGGGGGYIAISGMTANVVREARGGKNGTTDSPLMAAFPPNGATNGGKGLPFGILNGLPLSNVLSAISDDIAICQGTSATLFVSGGSGITWLPSTGLSCTDCDMPIANPTMNTMYYVQISSGGCVAADSVLVSVMQSGSAGIITANPDTLCVGEIAHLTLTENNGLVQWQSATGGNGFDSITGIVGTTYTVPLFQTTSFRTVAGSGTCADTSNSATVFVHPAITTPVLSTTTPTICASDSARIDVSAPYASYAWNTGATSPSIYVRNAGNYYVTVTDQNNCTSQSNLAISAYSVPPVSVTISGDTMTAYNAVSYQWYLDGTIIEGATDATYIATETGSYKVMITDNNGCKAFSNAIDIVVTDIEEASEKARILVYPNPANEYVFVSVHESAAIDELRLVNLLGQEVYKQSSLSESVIKLDISKLPAGAYSLVLFKNKQIVAKRILFR